MVKEYYFAGDCEFRLLREPQDADNDKPIKIQLVKTTNPEQAETILTAIDAVSSDKFRCEISRTPSSLSFRDILSPGRGNRKPAPEIEDIANILDTTSRLLVDNTPSRLLQQRLATSLSAANKPWF